MSEGTEAGTITFHRLPHDRATGGPKDVLMIRRSPLFLPLLFSLVILLVFLASAGCRPRLRSVVLITVSGWSATSPNGAPLPEPPSLLGGRVERVDRVFTPAPEAVPALAGIMTGRNPLGIGFRFGDLARLPADVSTLAERFRTAGFATAAFVGQPEVTPRTGLARGFDFWLGPRALADQGLTREEMGRLGQSRSGFIPASNLVEEARKWLLGLKEQPVFLWIHLADLPQEVAADTDAEAAYLRAWRGIDQALKNLASVLSSKGGGDRFVASLVSLHGLNLGEGGELLAGLQLTNRVLQVPARVEGGLPQSLPAAPCGLEAWGPLIEARSGLRPSGSSPTGGPMVAATFQPARFFGWPDQAWAGDARGWLQVAGETVWRPAQGPALFGKAGWDAAPADMREALSKLGITGSTTGGSNSADPAVLAALREARNASARGDAARGWQELTLAMEKAPNGIMPRRAAVGFLNSLPDKPEFVRFRERLPQIVAEAVDRAGDGLPRRLDVADLLQSTHQADRARTLLLQLENRPLASGERLALAQRLIGVGGLDEGIALLQPLAEQESAPELFELLGDVLSRQGSGFRARQAFEKAIALPRGRNANLVAKLGDTLAMLGEKDQALQRFAEAAALDPDYRYPHSRAADLLLELGRPGPAADAVVKSLPPTGDPVQDGLAQAHALVLRGLPGAAEQVLSELIKRKPEELRVNLMLARLSIDRGDRSLGQGLLEKVLTKDPGHPLALVELARVQALDQRFGAAREALHRAEVRAGPKLTQRVRKDEVFLNAADADLVREAAAFLGKGQGGPSNEGVK